MTYNPYSGGGGFTDDEFNGLHGEYSPEAILNQSNQSRPQAGGNPFDALLRHATDFGTASPRQSYRPSDAVIGGMYNSSSGAAGLTQPGGLGQMAAMPSSTYSPNGAGGDALNTPAGGYLGAPTANPFGGDALNTPAGGWPAQQAGVGQAVNPQTGKPYASTQKPPNVDQNTWDSVDRYVQDAAAQGHDYWFLYQHPEYVTEFRNWDAQNNAGGKVDIVDYLARVHPEYPHGLAGRQGGIDTMLKFMQEHPNQPGAPPAAAPTPAGASTALDDARRAHGIGAAQPASPGGPPPVYQQPAPTQPMRPSDDYLQNLDRALQVSQNRELQNALRDFRGAAASTGLQNTGAYLPGQADLVANLASRFGQQRAEAMLATSEAERGRAFQGNQSELNRSLQRYGIDVGAYTSRFNTTTQAGVQQAANQMQYDLGLKGIEVDRGRLEESIRNNTLGYNLGVGEQDLRKYQGDQNNQIQLMDLFRQIGPEAVMAMLFGRQAPPTNIYGP